MTSFTFFTQFKKYHVKKEKPFIDLYLDKIIQGYF